MAPLNGEAPPSREPEKLVLPAAAVARLLRLALRTQLGEEWWDGFATAHGAPSWLTDKAYAFRTQDAAVVRSVAGADASGAAG